MTGGGLVMATIALTAAEKRIRQLEDALREILSITASNCFGGAHLEIRRKCEEVLREK